MDPAHAALLVVSAVLGGGLNAVAGGGSFFTFPALVFVGIPVIPANATSALALWPGSVASAAAYRRDLKGERRRIIWLGTASLVGGAMGAVLLVRTPSTIFEVLVPFLMLLATLLFAWGPRLTAQLRAYSGGKRALGLAGATFVQWVISVYGGYFGGGMGMMMLAAFSLLGMDDIHRMNGLKALLAVAINGIAVAAFVVAGVIVWKQGLLMTAGAIAGGYGGAYLARRLPGPWVRGFITTSGLVLSAVFFARAFL